MTISTMTATRIPAMPKLATLTRRATPSMEDSR